jgi:hypothetical protein
LVALVVALVALVPRPSSAACTFTVDSSSPLSVPATSGYYKVSVSTSSACRWTATTTSSFIHLHSVAGFGDGTVAFAVDAADSGASRTGTIIISGNTFTVSQAGTGTPPTANAPTSGPVVHVPAGGNLQAALDAAVPGETITLQAGATYTGHFVLRSHGATASNPISLVTAGTIPPGRVSPSAGSAMARLMSPDNGPAIATERGVAVSGYTLRFLEIAANETQSELVSFGYNDSTQTSLYQVPHDLEIDRCYIHGSSTSNSKRGLGLHAQNVHIHESYFADFHVVGQDSQAIGGVNGIGTYVIENNYLEGAGENVMFGGDDPKIPGLVQSHITFRYNLVSRPMSWMGGPWSIKNLFELKLANEVLIEGNVFENHWPQAQKGVAIVFTPRNQYGTAPQSVVSNVTFRYNVVRNVSSAIEILGEDNNATSAQTHDIVIDNNEITVNSTALGGDGRFLNFDDGGKAGAYNVTVTHNTIHHDGSSLVYISGSHPWTGFVYENNLALHNKYGFMSSQGIGAPTIPYFFPHASFLSNVVAGANAKLYPTGNLYPSVTVFEDEFVDFVGGDYRLTPVSTYQHAGTDGKDLGADITTIRTMTGQR